MNIYENLKLIYNQDIKLNKTDLGLTNTIYTATINNQKVALREVTTNLASLAFTNEAKALSLVKPLNLDAIEIYYNETNRLRITKWIDNAIEFKDFKDKKDAIKRAALLLKKLHSAKLVSNVVFDGVLLLKEYQENIDLELFDLSQFDDVIKKYQSVNNEKILCHNDLVSGNILFTEEKDYLIDYEYSKDNDPLFDVMSFLTENQITDPELREIFFQNYFDAELSNKKKIELDIFENFHNLLWCSWANMMYDKHHKDIYKEIATDKYQALIRKK
ncbi:MAG: phosphotransferase [Anaerorhabdus sp.]